MSPTVAAAAATLANSTLNRCSHLPPTASSYRLLSSQGHHYPTTMGSAASSTSPKGRGGGGGGKLRAVALRVSSRAAGFSLQIPMAMTSPCRSRRPTTGSNYIDHRTHCRSLPVADSDPALPSPPLHPAASASNSPRSPSKRESGAGSDAAVMLAQLQEELKVVPPPRPRLDIPWLCACLLTVSILIRTAPPPVCVAHRLPTVRWQTSRSATIRDWTRSRTSNGRKRYNVVWPHVQAD